MSIVDQQAPEEAGIKPEGPPRSRAVVVMALFTVLAVAAALAGSELFNRQSTTADGDFEGETVEVLIPLAPGGGTDTWARFVGEELMSHVPGEPGLSPVNDDGGEGILGTNQFVATAAPDGTEVLVSTASTVVPWMLGRDEVKYDFNTMKPLMVNGTGGAIYARTGAGVQDVDDLVGRKVPLTFGGISATSLDLTTLVAFDLLGADVESVFGFEGRGPVNLALQRGEVDLDYQTTSSWESAVLPLDQEGSAVPLMSFGQLNESGQVVRDPNFPNLPTVPEVYEQIHGEPPAGAAYEAYKTLLGVTYTYQKAMWVPKETPQRTVETLRQPTVEMSQDPEFKAEAADVLGGYPLEADKTVADRIRHAYTVNDHVRAYLVDLLVHDYQVELDGQQE